MLTQNQFTRVIRIYNIIRQRIPAWNVLNIVISGVILIQIIAHSARIGKHNRIVVAVSEEIVALQAAVGAEDGIRAEEPADVGVVVSGVEVVPARFHVIVVPTIAERVHGSDGGGQAARHGQHFPPSVVRIAYHFHAVRVHDPQYVALYILMVPVLRSISY